MDVNKASGLVFFVVTVLGAVALMVILGYDNSISVGNVAVYQQAKPSFGIITVKARSDCWIPQTVFDLIDSDRKTDPFSHDTCHLIAQKACLTHQLNSGSCTQECLAAVQSHGGICDKGISSGITAHVVLTPEECKRLALSYDSSNVNFLRTVGAGAQSTGVINPCSGVSGPAAVKVYSAENPLQVFTRHVFSSGDVSDVSGYVVDSSQPALEYVLCGDGRARVVKEGQSVCNSL